MKKRKNIIFEKDWLQFQPMEKKSSTNKYYQNLSNKVYWAIYDAEENYGSFIMDDSERKILATILTCYFEDIISGAGIWQAFTNQHKKLYGKYLPFYMTDDYFIDEINLVDIKFLVWYFFSHVDLENFYTINDDGFNAISTSVYSLFDGEYETAPENNYLKEFFKLSDTEEDLYLIKAKIEWLFMRSYLFSIHEVKLMQELEEAMEWQDDVNKEQINMLMYDLRDTFALNQKSNLLALRGNTWLANILGEKHKLYNDILALSKKVTSRFLFVDETDSDLILKHIATGKIIPVTKKSFDSIPELTKDNSIVYLGVVKWRNEWWFSGLFSTQEYDEKVVEQEKLEKHSWPLFEDSNNEKVKVAKGELEYFFEYNDNKQIAFLEKAKYLRSYLDNFSDYMSQIKGLGEKEREEVLIKIKSKKLEELSDGEIPEDYKEIGAVVYFDKKNGVEILIGYNESLPDSKNISFKKVEPFTLLDIIMSQYCGVNLAKFLANNYNQLKEVALKDDIYKYTVSDFDFMLRFWKKDDNNF